MLGLSLPARLVTAAQVTRVHVPHGCEVSIKKVRAVLHQHLWAGVPP